MNQIRDDDLKQLWNGWTREMAELKENAPRTRKNINRFITLDYCRLIVSRLRKRLKDEQGDYYEPERLIAHLNRQNWKQYSFSGKAMDDDKLDKVLSGWYMDEDLKMPKKQAKDDVGFLVLQAYYLEEACRVVVDIAEVW